MEPPRPRISGTTTWGHIDAILGRLAKVFGHLEVVSERPESIVGYLGGLFGELRGPSWALLGPSFRPHWAVWGAGKAGATKLTGRFSVRLWPSGSANVEQGMAIHDGLPQSCTTVP